MFINKISNAFDKPAFKGYQHVKNDVGETIIRFNYPYDYKDNNEICQVLIYRVTKTDKLNYKIDETPIKTIDLRPEGVEVNLQRETNLDKDEDFAYKIVRKDKNNNVIWQGADTGVKMYRDKDGEYKFRVHNDILKGVRSEYQPIDDNGNPKVLKNEKGEDIKENYFWYNSSQLAGPAYKEWQYTLVKQNGTAPMVQGPGYLAMPDTFYPGMRYKGFDEEGTGDVVYDKEYQAKMENMVKTFNNMYGGSMAGLEAYLPELKKTGFKLLFTTPIANGDDRTSHGYWNKNNMQIAPNMGSAENYDSLMQKEFQNGIAHVFDATLTSEGLEGIHFRYALRWGEEAQTARWFRLGALKDNGLGLGVIPNDATNLRHRLINSPYKYELQSDGTYKKVKNDDYKSNQETFVQIYDVSQVTQEQLDQLDKPIDMYRELKAGKNLKINTYEDTPTNYVFEINPNEYQKNIDKINRLVKKDNKKIDLNTPDGTVMAMQFSNFHLSRTPDGYVAWDDNPDMVKMNYGISPYDEKELQAIVDRTKRQYEQELRVIASKEVQDMAVQVGVYWTDKTKRAHTVYTVQNILKLKSAEKINKLIEEGKLPAEVRVSQNEIDNILNGNYNLSPKGKLSKDDATVKAMMKLPLDSLEFAENTVGVLSTSYFSNRATTDETIGVSRFDLMKQDNPHLLKTYANVYNKVNNLFTNELNQFAQSVIKKVNETSNEPLIDSDGNYTEYGEYVIELLGQNIAKYALLKSLAGESFKCKMLPNGTLTYDYSNIRKATSLKALGINANNQTEEAEILQKKLQKGLASLSDNDISEVAKSISQVIKDTDVNTFRIAEALVAKSGLGLNFRLDAAKDVIDMDSVRDRDYDFDTAWTNLISFWSKYVQGVKSVNPNSYIVAEMTNVNEISADTFGGAGIACPYNGWTNFNNVKFNGEPDAMTKFFLETGITSEAAYAYFFTELLTSFSKDFETGDKKCPTHDDFKMKYDLLINTRSADYLRNLYTFMGNHDKARTLHGLAVDMSLFHSTLMYRGADFNKNHQQRLDAIRVLSGAYSMKDVPLELRLNVDNLDYFRTVNARAVAQSKLLMDSVGEDLEGIASKEDIRLIREALIDLANGNYLNSKTTEKMTKINIAELSSVENAVKEVARLAKTYGVNLSASEIQKIIDNVNNLNFDDYAIHGDYNWTDPKEIGDKNIGYLKEFVVNYSNPNDYSLYTVQIARMIKKASEGNPNASKINAALSDFVKTYNSDKISKNMTGYKMYESSQMGRKKNGYAAQDFRIALEEAINQAEFKTGRKIANKDDIIATVYQSVTEPALQKHAMILSFLGAFCGISTLYAGDEFDDTGYEDKSKNKTVKNRTTSRRTELEKDSIMGRLMRKSRDITYSALQNKANVKPLQNGTPYTMDVMFDGKNREQMQARIAEIDAICDPEKGLTPGCKLEKELRNEQNILRLQLAKVAFMMQGSDGDMAISVFNASGIEHDNRVNYFEKYKKYTKAEREKFLKENNIESINPNNPYVPIQEKSELDAILLGAGVTIPLGTVFVNADARDTAKYVVENIKGKIGIVRKEGEKICNIIFDGITSRNGVMVLRKAQVAFKGSKGVYNPQYNFVSDIYQTKEIPEQGKQLLIISK